MIALPEKYRVLVVDDEVDIHAATRLCLKGLRYKDQPVELLTAESGKETVEMLRANPDIAVILLDVVMETLTAGLDACKAIRGVLGNRFVRIILRTGETSIAPEKRSIEEYDIDGYLPKAEVTATRLYAATRTAIKAFDELVELERHRSTLAFMHDAVTSLHASDSLEVTLQQILATAIVLAPTALAILKLETLEEKGNPRRYLVHLAAGGDPVRAKADAQALANRVAADPATGTWRAACQFEDGFLVPLIIHRELGNGWLFVQGQKRDAIALQVLPVLAAHASNVIYSTIAQAMLAAREGPFYDSLIV